MENIFEVRRCPQNNYGLLCGYVDTENKQEASGHPHNCQTEEQMRSYKNTTDIFQREKLVLDPLQNEKKPCQGSHCQSLFKLLM